MASRCFLESDSFENCLRLAYSLNYDLDTVCCISGAIAEYFYGEAGFDDCFLLKKYLDADLLALIEARETLSKI